MVVAECERAWIGEEERWAEQGVRLSYSPPVYMFKNYQIESGITQIARNGLHSFGEGQYDCEEPHQENEDGWQKSLFEHD